MGLKSWLDDVIPNELKGNLGKIAAVAGAAYLGYKGYKSFTSPTGFLSTTVSGAAGMTEQVSGFGRLTGAIDVAQAKYPKTSKFISGLGEKIVGKAMEGESEEDARKRFAAEQDRINRMMMAKQYGTPTGVGLQNVGSFQASQVTSPGFNNSHVQESLNMVAYFMQDLRDNGRIDSSALYAEQTRGTTISLPTSKSLKMSI